MAEWETAPGASDGWETAPARLNPNLAAQGARAEGVQDAMRAGAEYLSQRDPGIDYRTGVKNALLRAGFSRMTNDAEKAQYLNRNVGKGAWGKDSFGAYFIRPEGLKRFGIESEIPVSLDEQTTTRYDVADIAGDAPAIAGGVGGGMAASGLGLIPGAAVAGLGAAGGLAIDEIVKNLQGQQVKGPGEVATELGKEFGMGATGEAIGRGAMAVGRFAAGPAASRMTPEKKALADSALAQGFKIRPGSVTDAPLLARWEGMVRQIFGDLYADQNRKAAQAGVERLSTAAGARVGKEAAGEAISKSIRRQRVTFAEKFGEKYAEIDALVGDVPMVPTAPIKEQAEALLAKMPKTTERTVTGPHGQIVVPPKVIGGKDAFIRDILQMGDAMTVQQAQRLRTMLREASESPDLVPDIAMHEARELRKAVDQAFEAAKSGAPGLQGVVPARAEEAINRLRTVDADYKNGIRLFDKPVVAAITRDASRGGVDADMVVEYLIKPERLVRLRSVKNLVPPAEWAKVKSAHAQELLSSVVKGTDDPLVDVFSGKQFRKALNTYGRDVLEEVHGKEWVDAAYNYANALMLAEKKMALSGGIVAANIALHPLKNMPKLLWLRVVSKVMEKAGTFKYLTEGIKAGPNTKAGAAALTRFASEVAALGRDETGSARFTLTAPPEGAQQ